MLAATKVARELRLESQHVGRSFLRATMALSPSRLTRAFWEQVQQGEAPGHHAVAFGLAGHELGVPENSALPAYLYTVAASLTAAAVRLVPLGQSDGQRLLARVAAELPGVGATLRPPHPGGRLERRAGAGHSQHAARAAVFPPVPFVIEF